MELHPLSSKLHSGQPVHRLLGSAAPPCPLLPGQGSDTTEQKRWHLIHTFLSEGLSRDEHQAPTLGPGGGIFPCAGEAIKGV